MAGKSRREQTIQREREAWRLRCRGWTQDRIAAALGVSQPAVSGLLARARDRARGDADSYLLDFVGQLDHAAEEAYEAWHRSKEPLRRVRQTTDDDGNTVTVNEAVEREGNVAYLHTAYAALDRKAKVLGLNVADAQQAEAFTVASLAESMKARADAYEKRTTDVPSGDTGGAPPDPGSGD